MPMTSDARERRLFTRYVLGQVSEDERAEVEARYLADDSVFEALVGTEDALLRSYLKGTLPEAERRALSDRIRVDPELRRKLEFEASLKAYLASEPERPRASEPVDSVGTRAPWLSAESLWRAAAVVLLVTSASLLVSELRLRGEIERLRAQAAVSNLQRAAGAREPGPRSLPPSLEPLAAGAPFVLYASRLRSAGGDAPLAISAAAVTVPLALQLPETGAARYAAVVATPDGARVWHAQELKDSALADGSRAVVLAVPAHVLSDGTYVVTLTGVSAAGQREDLAAYAFRIVRR
jgi:hypothetical protein